MIENIISMVKDNVGGDLMSKFGMSNEQADKTIATGSETVLESLKNKAMGGDFSSITSIFGGNSENANPLNNVGAETGGDFVSNLMSKVGLPQSVAEKVSAFLLPKITEIFSSKMQGADGGFDFSNITNMFGNYSDSKEDGIIDKLKDTLGDNLGGLGNLMK